ncbi:MAG TPA: biotin carboxylase N-terminal domain-containing protein [Myxococcota bacterium]|nr:biotin carboxylase N-terminal domain-containing protein [Myxococcota bacterium]HRY97011.1 biotin carboxylase N-terminal domain-containing protein [Myxococcota bacterium]
MFERILIANRGEIALRIARTCRELGVRTVAVHSPVDARAPHALYADERVALPGDAPAESYLNMARLLEAARATGAQAIHPGYGFLSENGDFAEACAAAGLAFIGPPARVLRAVGDKLQARRLAQAAGVPITPGLLEPTGDAGALVAQAERLGFPIMLKAAAGGGGKGMRRVERAEELPEALARAASEARGAFGDERLYLEKCLLDPRHVEVQILADQHGQVVHLFERECSIQRRHQKIIEEAPSPGVDEALRERLCAAAVQVARAAGYQNAGTVEFLLDRDGRFYFMEVNARLQVEHPITEAICGLDLVRAQLRLAAGEPLGLSQADLTRRGHALECRLYAEDAEHGFLPSPGRIAGLRSPTGPGVRFDCGVEAGSEVPVHYDPILAKLICQAEDRPAAIARMQRALAETAVLGVATPLELLLDVVGSEPFRAGDTSTGFLARHFADWHPDPGRRQALLLGWLAAELSGHAGRAREAAAGAPAAADASPWHTLGRWRMEG